jgi:hypothetical protein
MMVYNIKRIINVLGIDGILKKLKNWTPDYKRVTSFSENRPILSLYKPRLFYNNTCHLKTKSSHKPNVIELKAKLKAKNQIFEFFHSLTVLGFAFGRVSGYKTVNPALKLI